MNRLKHEYVRTCLERYKNDSKKLWKEIRLFWPSSKNAKVKIGNILGATDNKSKAEHLNNYFSMVGQNLSSEIPYPTDDEIEMCKVTYRPPVFELSTIVVEDVSKAIHRLSSSRSCATDGFTSFMFKSCCTTISDVLCSMFNLNVATRSFANVWKLSKVTPLHKTGCTNTASNFRPISIIPTVGKILERIVHCQTVSYLESSNILSEAQSGFRAGRSMGTCLIDFLNNIYQGVDRGCVCGVVSLDLAKAFDTVDHNILLSKLQALGFRYSAKSWFESYLSDRIQQTVVEGHLSFPKQIKCGVPQGSILGPLLFICYINDLQNLCHSCTPYLYADDSALICVDENPLLVSEKLQSDLHKLSVWFKVNKLSVNCTKTNSILFTSQRSRHKNYQLSLTLNDTELNQVREIKYLGLVIDQHLTFESHIMKLCGKISARTGLMWRIRSFILKIASAKSVQIANQPTFFVLQLYP